jgi:quinol monooxygenase YgiN
MAAPGYVHIWEYRVRPECTAEFEALYGPDGAWVALFRRAGGHLRTELHRDLDDATRYVTIDHFESQQAWEAARAAVWAEYEALDARCGRLTLEEREVGRWEPVG